MTKPTLRRYLEYLEAAFLIKIVHRIDHNAHRFRRATRFKVYVTTPALRAALFGPVRENDEAMGALAESAVFAQWFHADIHLHYARWRAGRETGEVDLVHLDQRQKPSWCLDVKWSDRPGQRPDELASLANFARRHPDATVLVTTRTLDRSVSFWPGPGLLNAGTDQPLLLRRRAGCDSRPCLRPGVGYRFLGIRRHAGHRGRPWCAGAGPVTPAVRLAAPPGGPTAGCYR